ncbi:MAG: glucosidase, partial [Chloroflexi bacterium]
YFYFKDTLGTPDVLFTENDTNTERLYGQPNASPYVKDAFHNYIVRGQKDVVNPAQRGTKAAPHYSLEIGGGESTRIRLRLTDAKLAEPFGAEFDAVFDARKSEVDEFYATVIPATLTDDENDRR